MDLHAELGEAVMVKKVLGILGSPSVKGNTAILLDAVLNGASRAGAEVERLDLARMDIHPCTECKECEIGTDCVQHRDDMSKIYKRIREVDAIVLASPIFFMDVTAQTKAMIDRCQCFWYEKYVMKRRAYEGRRMPKGLFVSCAGSTKPIVFESAIHVVKAFFSAIDYEYAGEVLLNNTDDPDLSAKMESVSEEARAAGRRICE